MLIMYVVRLTSSPIGKRPLALENDEVQLKKKKRESLLNVPFSGEEVGQKVS